MSEMHAATAGRLHFLTYIFAEPKLKLNTKVGTDLDQSLNQND